MSMVEILVASAPFWVALIVWAGSRSKTSVEAGGVLVSSAMDLVVELRADIKLLRAENQELRDRLDAATIALEEATRRIKHLEDLIGMRVDDTRK